MRVSGGGDERRRGIAGFGDVPFSNLSLLCHQDRHLTGARWPLAAARRAARGRGGGAPSQPLLAGVRRGGAVGMACADRRSGGPTPRRRPPPSGRARVPRSRAVVRAARARHPRCAARPRQRGVLPRDARRVLPRDALAVGGVRGGGRVEGGRSPRGTCRAGGPVSAVGARRAGRDVGCGVADRPAPLADPPQANVGAARSCCLWSSRCRSTARRRCGASYSTGVPLGGPAVDPDGRRAARRGDGGRWRWSRTDT